MVLSLYCGYKMTTCKVEPLFIWFAYAGPGDNFCFMEVCKDFTIYFFVYMH
jgi:hypothetical protein